MILDALMHKLDWAIELIQGAKSNNWPKNGAAQDILDYATWKAIKEADSHITIDDWNQFNAPSRADIIAAAPGKKMERITKARENRIKQAAYQRDNQYTRFEKVAGGIGTVTGHWGTDFVSGGLGFTSSVLGAKGEADKNDDLKDAGSGVGKASDILDTTVQTGNLLDSIGKWRSGSRLDNANSSRAARSLGRKKGNEGKWGASQSALGLGGSVSALVSDFGEDHKENNAADYTSGGFGVAGGLLGSIKSFKGFFGSRQRSNKAEKIAKDAATDPALKGIAEFTQKKQNRAGRVLEGLKGLASIGGGVAKLFGSSLGGAIAGGIGLTSGIGAVIAKRAGKPDGNELTQKAKDLIQLLLKAENIQAVKFARDVLKIADVGSTPESGKEWVLEDPEAAEELIKSKLSKN